VNSRNFATLIRVFSGLLFLVSLCAWLFLPGLFSIRRSLAPYVSVTTDLPHIEAVERLQEAGYTDIIAPSTTMVHLSRIARVDEVSLAEAEQLLDPLDPRRDPFMTELWRYFQRGDRNVLLVNMDGGGYRAHQTVQRVLGPGSAVVERTDSLGPLSLGLFLCIAVLLILISPSGRTGVSIAAIPLIPGSYLLGIPFLCAGVGVLATASWVFSSIGLSSAARLPGLGLNRLGVSGRASAAKLIWLGSSIGFAGVYMVVIAGAGAGLALVIAILGAAGGVIAYLYKSPLTRLDDGHKAFEPVPILSGRGRWRRPRRWAAVAAASIAVIGLSPLVYEWISDDVGVSRPVVVTYDRPYSLAGLEMAFEDDSAAALPGLADYLAHRAYQEAFGYNVPYEYPTAVGSVEVSRFAREDDGSISTFQETVIEFDQVWFQGVLQDLPYGVPSFLGSFGRPVGVVLAPVESVYSGYSPIVLHAVFVIFLMVPYIPSLVITRRSPRSEAEMLVKRIRQVANA
jgi:hypothetical protein